MPTNEKRRAAVQIIIEERFEGRVVDFAKAIERSRAQVWQFMNERGLGEKLARDIESKLGLAHGALDGEEQSLSGFSEDEVELVKKYRSSSAHWRVLLQKVGGIKPQDQEKTLAEALMFLLARVKPPKRAKQKK